MKKGLKRIKTPNEELELMSNFKQSQEYVILKRWINRYISNMKDVSFKLLEHEPSFPFRHAEYAGQALGLKTLLKFIDGAEKEIREESL